MTERKDRDSGHGGRPAPASTAARGKAEARAELERAMQQFLSRGGEVRRVPAGASAWDPGARPAPSRPLFSEKKDTRTPLTDVVARLEARREAMKAKRRRVQKPRAQRARRRVIYDDFGEPLRHVWVDE